MKYLEKKVFTDDEQILVTVKRSATCLIWRWIFGIGLFWLMFIPTVIAVVSTVRFFNTEYVITKKRIMKKSGSFSTSIETMPLEKIDGIVVTFSFWGRLFGYGTIVFQGENWKDVTFTCVKDVEDVRLEIIKELSK